MSISENTDIREVRHFHGGRTFFKDRKHPLKVDGVLALLFVHSLSNKCFSVHIDNT